MAENGERGRLEVGTVRRMMEVTEITQPRTRRQKAQHPGARVSLTGIAESDGSTTERELLDRARKARDSRFDGRFYFAVTTTGIYCRPTCPAPRAKAKNVRYYPTAAAAAADGYRPCRRCRPELAPGLTSSDSGPVARAMAAIDEGALDAESTVGELAGAVGCSERQLRRLFRDQLGATPNRLAQTRRLLFARRLLRETDMTIIDVAFASGFGSLRRFNQAFRDEYGCAPSRFRNETRSASGATDWTLRLAYREPFDWHAFIRYFEPRAIPGVETVLPDREAPAKSSSLSSPAYARTFSWEGLHGILTVRPAPDRAELVVAVRVAGRPERLPPLLPLVATVRRMFDLDADPEAIGQFLGQSERLAPALGALPGVRVPGCFDAFELAVRAVLGQQVTVKGASTLAGRLVARWGVEVGDVDDTDAPASVLGGLQRLFPSPEIVAEAPVEEIGLPGKRAETLRRLAESFATGPLSELGAGSCTLDPRGLVEQLESIPGIGDWTAQYVAMRALRDPDAFPAGDLGLRKAVGGVSERELRELAESWRPWRAYAAMLLWSLPAGATANEQHIECQKAPIGVRHESL